MGSCVVSPHWAMLLVASWWVSNGLFKHLRACEGCVYFASTRAVGLFCEHASGAFIISSKSSDQICFACTEHFRKYLMTSSEHFVNLTHLTREILTDATENNCIAKSYFQFLSSTQIVPVSKVILNWHSICFQFENKTVNNSTFQHFSDSGHNSD